MRHVHHARSRVGHNELFLQAVSMLLQAPSNRGHDSQQNGSDVSFDD